MARPDYMMLTLSSPARHNFDYKPTHEFVAHRSTAVPSSLSTPPPERTITSNYHPTSATLTPAQLSSSSAMTAPHRGLPLPAPLALPDSSRLPHPIPGQGHSSLPAPPPQWHGMEEPMRNWLATKAEEEKRKQEEEKTQQETLRLEQKKIEQNMLQEVIRSGYPPTLVPMLFMALGGALSGVGNTAAGLELLQQYLAPFTSQQPGHPPSPEAARERMMAQGQSSAYASAQSVPPTPLSGPFGGYSGGRVGTGSGPLSAQRSHFPGGLTRLSTAEGGSVSSGPHSTTQQEQQNSLLFHHWQPPPPTETEGSGGARQPPITPSDYASSPKKRKAPSSHQTNPPPSSTLRFSESSNNPRRVANTSHSRQRSDASSRDLPMPQPDDRPPMSRPRTETLTTEHSSTGSEQQWQHHRYGSQQPPQLRGQRPEAHSESPSHGSFEGRSRRSSHVLPPSSANRTPTADERGISRGDVEMLER